MASSVGKQGNIIKGRGTHSDFISLLVSNVKTKTPNNLFPLPPPLYTLAPLLSSSLLLSPLVGCRGVTVLIGVFDYFLSDCSRRVENARHHVAWESLQTTGSVGTGAEHLAIVSGLGPEGFLCQATEDVPLAGLLAVCYLCQGGHWQGSSSEMSSGPSWVSLLG